MILSGQHTNQSPKVLDELFKVYHFFKRLKCGQNGESVNWNMMQKYS